MADVTREDVEEIGSEDFEAVEKLTDAQQLLNEVLALLSSDDPIGKQIEGAIVRAGAAKVLIRRRQEEARRG